MGRAHEVRAASMAKTNLAKSKLYSKYGKLIYMEARNGWDMDGNLKLRALVEKAKKEQVPADVIKRNIDKAKGGSNESYESCRYEAYGPSGSTFIIECLTDNTNRTISALKGYFGKCGLKLGNPGSVSYNYDYVGVISLKGLDEEGVLEACMMAELEPTDVYSLDDGSITVLTKPTDLNPIKDCLTQTDGVEVLSDEVKWMPKEYITVPDEDIEKILRFFTLVGDNDDVTNVYNNVDNLPEEE